MYLTRRWTLKTRRCSKGFTLLELLVVLAIIGILTAIGVAAFSAAQLRARDAQRKSDLKTIASALERYRSKNGTYPDSSLAFECGTTEWYCSNSGNLWWIPDLAPAGGTTYIKVLPKDPKNTAGTPCNTAGTGTAYTYAYKSSQLAGTPDASRKYILTAHLENTNDKDESATYPDCFVLESP
jgi:type II secretion system protein G